jgi:hypothetical protein
MKRLSVPLSIFATTLLGTATIAAAQPAGGLTVVVNDEYYVLGNQAFDHLDALEIAVRDAGPPTLALDVCGAGASRALKSAVHRFDDLPLLLRVLDRDAPACRTAAALGIHGSQRSGSGPFGIDHAAVEDYWRRVMP